MILNDIPEIALSLKTEKTQKIKLLHKLLFNELGDRLNRSRIRNFEGFNFQKNDSNFQTKLAEITKTFSLIELISIANILKIDIDGTLPELAERILSFLTNLESLQENVKNTEISDVESEEIPNSTQSKVQSDSVSVHNNEYRMNNQINYADSVHTKLPFNFNDIDHLIPKFGGEKHENVNLWIRKFETFAESFNFPDIQKFIFAQRALSGIASLFVKSECNIYSYSDLKSALISEFGQQINSAEIHEILNRRRIKDNESVFEYFLIMREIASRVELDDMALIHYVIQGINDSPQNKIILYDATNLTEFKTKLKIYEEIKRHCQKIKTKAPVVEQSTTNQFHNKNSKVIRCFNCGKNGHKSVNCRDKIKGLKCFKCNSFGHKASDNKCSVPTDIRNSSVRTVDHHNTSRQEMHKLVKISSIPIHALVDTGSYATLLREDIYHQSGLPELQNATLTLNGFGSSAVQPIGSFQGDIEIDNDIFSTTIYVIAQHQMNLPLIIGTDIITQGTLTVNKDSISLRKDNTDNFFIYLIDAIDNILDVDLTHIVDKKCKQEVSQLINSYKPNKTKTTDMKMSIILKDDIPVCQRARRMSVAEKQFVSKQIDEWLKDGIIKPSCSEYASPIVLVKKKDNSIRLCIDFRKLNKKIIKDHYPLPLIDDILDQLQSATVFTSIDLKNGFFHVDIDPNCTKFTSFVTHHGQYEFLKAPFGLTTSPAAFNRYLSCVFRELIADGTLILYMDDFIIPSKTEEEGLLKLKRVLEIASSYGLHINFKKCQFLQRKVEFLGHVIENNTISPSPSKIKAVLNFPEPKDVKHLQSFLGLAGYFRKYIPKYATIARPLSDLLRKSSTFVFGPAEKTAFLKLKELLTQQPVLHLFVPGSELEVHTDASKLGFGAVLLQKSHDEKFHPVLYMSRKTSPQEEKLHSYELEVLAVVEALKKFRVYLHGTKFKIVTDCEAFQKTMDKAELSAKIARWALLLQDFDYAVSHRPAKQMQHVDALSRYPVMIITPDDITQKIIKSQSTDEFIVNMKKAVEESPNIDFKLKNGVLYKLVEDQELLVVPQTMYNELIQHAHSKGHFSVQKTTDIIKRDYYIPNLNKLVQTIIANCITCILSSRKSGKPEGFLYPIPKGDTPLDTYHVDFLGPLPSTNKNYKHLFSVVDAFTKFIWIYPVKSTSAQDALDKLKLQQTVFGNPRRIISDKGPAFTSNEFQSYCNDENIEYIPITTGVPRGNGQIERMQQTIIAVLTKLSLDDPTKWYKHVSKVQRILNSTISQTTQFSPFELMLGIKMRNTDDIQIKQLLEEEHFKHTLNEKQELRDLAKANILQHQAQSKRYYDKRRKPPKIYKIGDLVAIQRTQFGPGLKLKIKFFGPYKVTAVKDHDRYDVEKVGNHEGPNTTSSSADLMKPWSTL